MPSPNDLIGGVKGAGKAVGEFVQGGGQWMENIFGMPVSPPRTTSTGRDVFQANSTQERIGKALGGVGLTLAGGMAGGPTMAGQVAAGGLAGALQNPDSPYGPAIAGMAAPPIAAGISKAIPLAKALIQGTDPAAAKFNQVAAAVKGAPINSDGLSQALVNADLLSKTGSTPPKVVKDLFKWEGPIDYDAARRFANRAGSLTAAEKMETDPSMKRVVTQIYTALKEGNREAAVKAGVGPLYDEAMREFRIGKGVLSLKEALTEVLKNRGVQAAVGTGAAYGMYKALSK